MEGIQSLREAPVALTGHNSTERSATSFDSSSFVRIHFLVKCNMCHKQAVMSPLPIKFAKITVIVVFFCFAECAAGSCLSYGHACWGAHGKRSNPIRDTSSGRDSRWFLSRLVQTPLDLRYVNDRDLDAPTSQQLFSDAQMEADALKGQDEYRNIQDSFSNEENALFEDIYPRQRTRSNKIKTSKLLEKRSARMI